MMMNPTPTPWPRACACRLRVVVATSGREGLRLIEEQTFDIIISDLIMDGVGGLEILAKAKHELPDAEVVILTGHGTIKTAVTAMQAGATTYLTKPLDIGELRTVVDKASQSQRLARSNIELKKQLYEKFGFEGVIGNSAGDAFGGCPAPPDRTHVRFSVASPARAVPARSWLPRRCTTIVPGATSLLSR